MIAHGLRNNPAVEFWQYPPLPQSSRSKLDKLYDSGQAWEDLNTNLIINPQQLSEKIAQNTFDLVILADHQEQLIQTSGVNWRQKLLGLRGRRVSLPPLPLPFAELCQRLPVAVIDLTDPPYLDPTHRTLLEHCAAYFKREVPYNRFTLYHTLFPFQYIGQSGKDPELLALLDKVHGIPLGIQDDKFQRLITRRAAEQDIDVFWGGRISSTMRRVAESRLRDFAARTSWNIVMPQAAMPFQEYCRTVARSKITLSVEGGGWDCDRHYEAAALGSLPLMNTPTTDAVWWHPLPKDVFFANDFSDFASRIEALLTNATLQAQCRQQVESQIRARMLWSHVIDYIVTITCKIS